MNSRQTLISVALAILRFAGGRIKSVFRCVVARTSCEYISSSKRWMFCFRLHHILGGTFVRLARRGSTAYTYSVAYWPFIEGRSPHWIFHPLRRCGGLVFGPPVCRPTSCLPILHLFLPSFICVRFLHTILHTIQSDRSSIRTTSGYISSSLIPRGQTSGTTKVITRCGGDKVSK